MAKTIWRFGTQAAQSSQQSQQKGANGGTGSGTIGAGSNGAASNGGTPAGSLVVPSADSKKFGFENFANNCYANSVVQALYFCSPFRDLMLQALDESVSQEVPQPLPPQNAANSPPTKTPPPTSSRWKPERKHSTAGLPGNATSSTSTGQTGGSTLAEIPTSPPSLFSALRSLFFHISTHPADKGTVSPRIFIDKLKDLNEMFRPTMHQDAHEFLNYLLNQIVEEVQEQKRQALANGNAGNGAGNGEDLTGSVTTGSSKTPPTVTTLSNSGTPPAEATLVHKLFEGVLTSETRCLTCETVSSRDESFLDLSIDIEQNSSVTACLRQFSASEMLCQKNKFFCDSCCDLQEAEKRMKIKKLPNVLALHLKRFKYQEDVQRYIKLAYRVAFPFELRLFNTVDDIENADRLYHLFGIVVHIGNGPHQGHYVSIIKTMATWFVFDDTTVSPIAESDIHKYFGESNSGSAYVLFYQAGDIDLPSLGLRAPPPPQTNPNSTSITAPEFLSPFPPIPTVSGSPSNHPHLQTSNTPSLPPGLLSEEGDSSDQSDPTFPSTPSSSSPLQVPTPNDHGGKSPIQTEPPVPPSIPQPISIQVSGSDQPADSSASTSTTASKLSKGKFSSLRPTVPSFSAKSSSHVAQVNGRAVSGPSIKGERSSTSALEGRRSATMGPEHSADPQTQRQVPNRSSTQLSTGRPSVGLDDGTSSNGHGYSPTAATPSMADLNESTPLVDAEGEDRGSSKDKGKGKDKDKLEGKGKPRPPERKPSGWFSRRSFRIGDSKDKDKDKAWPPAGVNHSRGYTTTGGEPSHHEPEAHPASSWFKTTGVSSKEKEKRLPSGSHFDPGAAHSAPSKPKSTTSKTSRKSMTAHVANGYESGSANSSVGSTATRSVPSSSRRDKEVPPLPVSATEFPPAVPALPDAGLSGGGARFLNRTQSSPFRTGTGMERGGGGGGDIDGMPTTGDGTDEYTDPRPTFSTFSSASLVGGGGGSTPTTTTTTNTSFTEESLAVPPVPPLPPSLIGIGVNGGGGGSHERQMSGYVLVGEPEEFPTDANGSASDVVQHHKPKKGWRRSEQEEASDLRSYSSHTTTTHPSAATTAALNGLGSWGVGNHSLGSNTANTSTSTSTVGIPLSGGGGLGFSANANASNASQTLRRATRKLSLTAPMLGFGRKKDEEKDRHKEKDKSTSLAAQIAARF